MFVFEITTPGTWLDYEDHDWSWRIEGLLRNLESQFFEANAALNLFIQAQSSPPARPDRDQWKLDARRRSEIRQQVEHEQGGQFFVDHWSEIYFETEVRFKREQWSKGRMPREFAHNQAFIYARAFLYALDSFDKFLGVLSREPGVPQELVVTHSIISEFFPDLRGVRNTAQHLEDRARGLGAGRDPKPLDLKPIVSDAIHAPGGGVLVLNSLNGSKYGSTMADGHYGEVDVSPESMQKLHYILHEALALFRWKGPKRHSPSI
ncbi:hypothetical protein [Aromatoleum petrolei]|uniref:Uncharacterized protein n=1 Tax=Aromatoleum petrolei TaxID=76116 RepID=A0ABX1MM48_9RHOO|nr:hypothetical protein [Aromatoleum petrolei]NMF88266.1 hypothetical protein [Aromatoleum petrolei]QTQ38035.1 Uncharacterized protein ToN1_39310 [Aromatoleum petrolei]